MSSFFPIHPASPWTGWVVFILGIFLTSVFWSRKKIVLVGFCVVFAALGQFRSQWVQEEILADKLAVGDFQKTAMVFTGRVVQDPDKRIQNTRLVVSPDHKSLGKILVTVDRFSDYAYGDVLKISGKLHAPPRFDDFDYQGFLAKDEIYSVMYYSEIELVERGNYGGVVPLLYAKVLELKEKFRGVISQTIPGSKGEILGAILLGDQGRLSDEVKEQWNKTGVRHLMAISGQNVTILSNILMAFFIGIGFWRGQAFYATVFLIALFVVLTGAEASAVRAGIMGSLFLLGQHLGRLNVSLRALVFAAALMLAFNPLLLSRDVGFQLSFLAVLGIIEFFPFFEKLFRMIPRKLAIRDILAMTIAAQVLTLPIVMYTFGYVSLVSIIVNLLIVPAVPFLIVLGFLFLLTGLLWEFLGFVLALPLFFLLSYSTFIVELLSRIPFASLPVEHFSPWMLVLLYLPIGFFLWKVRERQEFPFSSL